MSDSPQRQQQKLWETVCQKMNYKGYLGKSYKNSYVTDREDKVSEVFLNCWKIHQQNGQVTDPEIEREIVKVTFLGRHKFPMVDFFGGLQEAESFLEDATFEPPESNFTELFYEAFQCLQIDQKIHNYLSEKNDQH